MNTNNENNNAALSRLKWACRRGMLELDVLLLGFLNGKYAQLCEADQILFAELLEQSDPELFAWLLGNQTPDEKFINLVTLIRQHASTSKL